MECIQFLLTEALAEPFTANKFGYIPSDIAYNYSVRSLFERLIPGLKPHESEHSSFYGRTAFNGVLRHNDRISAVQRLMHTY